MGLGDRNTTYFHATTSERSRSNHNRGLFSQGGEWRSDEQGMAGILLNYFNSLFLTSNPSSLALEEVLAFVGPIVSNATNELMLAHFTTAEV